MPPNRRGTAGGGAPSNSGFATVNRFALALSEDEIDADPVEVSFEQMPAIDRVVAPVRIDDVAVEEFIVDAQPVEDPQEDGFVDPRRRPQRTVAPVFRSIWSTHQDDQRSAPQRGTRTYRNEGRHRSTRTVEPEFGPEFSQRGKWTIRHRASDDLWVFEHGRWRPKNEPDYIPDDEESIEPNEYECMEYDPWRGSSYFSGMLYRQIRQERMERADARRNASYTADQRRRLIPVDPSYYHERAESESPPPEEFQPMESYLQDMEYQDEPVWEPANFPTAESPAAPAAANRNRRRRDRRERDPLRQPFVAPPAPPAAPVVEEFEDFEEFEPVDALPRNPIVVDQSKKARLDRERAENNHPARLAVRYSRECGICNTPNPRVRVVSTCGHVLCSPCSEELEDVGPGVKCPFCRNTTTYIRMYEQEVEDESEEKEAPTGTIEA